MVTSLVTSSPSSARTSMGFVRIVGADLRDRAPLPPSAFSASDTARECSWDSSRYRVHSSWTSWSRRPTSSIGALGLDDARYRIEVLVLGTSSCRRRSPAERPRTSLRASDCSRICNGRRCSSVTFSTSKLPHRTRPSRGLNATMEMPPRVGRSLNRDALKKLLISACSSPPPPQPARAPPSASTRGHEQAGHLSRHPQA